MTDLKALKERISCVEVLEHIGVQFGYTTSSSYADTEVQFFCPFCEDEGSSRPAGRVNDMKNVWHCWSCGRGGTVIDLAMEHVQGDFTAGLTWLLTNWPEEDALPDPWAAQDAS